MPKTKETICIDCGNKVIERDGKKYICPNIKCHATQIQPFWEEYKVIPVNCKDREGKEHIEDTYKVIKCKYFRQKQKPKLSPILQTKQWKPEQYNSNGKIYLATNQYEEEHKDEIIKQMQLERRLKEQEEKNESQAKKKKEQEEIEQRALEGKPANRKWNNTEIQFLIDNYPTMTEENIGFNLGRSTAAIHIRAMKLKLKKPSDKYTKEQVQAVIDYFSGKTKYKSLDEFAISIGRTSGSVLQKAAYMGIRQRKVRGQYRKTREVAV